MIILYILFIIGSLICFLNFYLSFLDYPVQRLIHGKKKKFKSISGLPLVGSLFVAISLIFLYKSNLLLTVGLILIAIDTGGIHWFLGITLFYSLKDKKGK